MGKHAFATFHKADFASLGRIFWGDGYRAAASTRDMDAREMDLSPARRNRISRRKGAFGYALSFGDFRMVWPPLADSILIIDEF